MEVLVIVVVKIVVVKKVAVVTVKMVMKIIQLIVVVMSDHYIDHCFDCDFGSDSRDESVLV